eukprot:1686292-Alexandrium_andersonii.AAC.1
MEVLRALPASLVCELARLFCGKLDGSVSCSWGESLVSLLEKRLGASEPGHYRPISLISCVEKLYDRCLYYFLEEPVKQVAECQHGFVPGRQGQEMVCGIKLACQKGL